MTSLRAEATRGACSLVIFDCDGVLVDSEGITMRELTQAINAVDVPMTEPEVHAAFVGGSMQLIEREVGRRRGAPVPDGWIDDFYAHRARIFETELEPVPGARELVEAVQALGVETCIASQGRPGKMTQTLALTGLDDLFPEDRVFSASMVARPKPAPDLFLHAAQTCGAEPADCVVVEDSPLGVRGARAAGMRVIAYVAPERPEDDALALAAAGAEVVRTLAAVPRLLAAA